MNIKSQELDKQELIRRLRLVKDIVSKLIDQMEAGIDWELAHPQFVVAVAQLKSVNRQLAIHHLVVCIANRIRKQQNSVESQNNINEYIKTFNYIN